MALWGYFFIFETTRFYITAMILKKLTLKNWKSFKEATFSINEISVIIGTNGSGKSNACEALRFLHDLASGFSLHDILSGNNSALGIRGGLEWLVREGETATTLGCILEKDNYEYEYSITLEQVTENELPFLKIKEEKLFRYYLSRRKNGETNRKKGNEVKLFTTAEPEAQAAEISAYFYTAKQGRGKKLNFNRNFSLLHQSQGQSMLKEVQEAIEGVREKLKKIFFLEPVPSHMRDYSPLSRQLAHDGANIAGVLLGLPEEKRKETLDKITRYLRALPEKEITSVVVKPVGEFKRDAMLYCYESWPGQEAQRPADLRSLSDGTLRFLAILVALFTIPEGSLFIIEEIDNGLHASREKALIKILEEVSSTRQIDIFCTTHREAMLAALDNSYLPFISIVHRDAEGWSSCTLADEHESAAKWFLSGGMPSFLTNPQVEKDLKNTKK